MNLIIDIGNTSAKMALFDGGDIVGDVARTDNERLAGLTDFIAGKNVERAILSSVVGVSGAVRTLLDAQTFKTIILTGETPLPIPSVYKFPPGMGADRIAADVAAVIAAKGRPALVFDAGTCLTCELLHPEKGIVGGIISPGYRLRLLSMHEHTAALPLVGTTLPHPDLLGTDTETAMTAGAWNSVTFEIEGYVRRLWDKYDDLAVFVTGGDCFSFDNLLKSRICQDKLLLLRGLNHILEFNGQ